MNWFDPREGNVAMTRTDRLLAGLFVLGSFVLCVLWVQFPSEKYFDEVYYARAGEEYLRNLDVSGWGPFEFTHPPLTKLLIALSMLLFGGLHGLGDTGLGWRFLNVVVGALMVGVLYAFAKRLTGSTLFASFAAGMLMLDGFHYTQSRIATPEITVAFLSLLTLYAFYRLWLATQIVQRRALRSGGAARALGITMAAGAVAAGTAWLAAPHLGPLVMGAEWIRAAQAVLALWTLVLFWLVGRVVVAPRFATACELSYADGTRVLADAPHAVVETQPHARDARVWWIVLPLASALLADAKWSGLFDFAVVWVLAAAVGAQRLLRRPALFGNPFGVPLDVLVAAMIVAGGIVYLLSYVPYFAQGHGFADLVAMQHGMYRYHATLVATHRYASEWWQWPLMDRPILYWAKYSHTAASGGTCCIATIRALPNPFVWLFGLISVPVVAWLALRERHKGYTLLIVAYLFQWLPWIGSPRLAFEYHFFPNLAIIVLANAVVLQRVWNAARASAAPWGRYLVAAYGLVVVVAFAYFYPIVSGAPISWDAWGARMWNSNWI